MTSLNGQDQEDRFTVEEPVVPIQPVTQRPAPKPDVARPNNNQGQVNQFQSDDAVCGIPVAGFTQSLVIGGQPAGHGEW